MIPIESDFWRVCLHGRLDQDGSGSGVGVGDRPCYFRVKRKCRYRDHYGDKRKRRHSPKRVQKRCVHTTSEAIPCNAAGNQAFQCYHRIYSTGEKPRFTPRRAYSSRSIPPSNFVSSIISVLQGIVRLATDQSGHLPLSVQHSGDITEKLAV